MYESYNPLENERISFTYNAVSRRRTPVVDDTRTSSVGYRWRGPGDQILELYTL